MASASLGPLGDIPESGGRGFSLAGGLNVFAVRRGDEVRVYLNRCPHAHLPLNWAPDRFLDRSKRYIQCSAHGALFEIATGHCIAGPCAGASLTAIAHRLAAGDVHIEW